MRPGWRWGAGLAALGAVAWLVFAARPEAGGTPPGSSRPMGSKATSVLQALLRAELPVGNPEQASLAIQGTVQGPRGPVPGARVLATMAAEEELLSTLPCEGIPDVSLSECPIEPREWQVREWVEQRRAEVPVRAHAVTGADGSFSLPGLEAGSYALWVESAEGVAFQSDVVAGTAPVELRLRVGTRASGTVTDDTKTPVPGALVIAAFASHHRFFESVTDATGRFQLGSLPPGEFLVIIEKEGLLTLIRPTWAYRAEVTWDFELSRPRSITGLVLRGKAPVAGVEVRSYNRVTQRGSATTDAAGRFSFEGLPPGSYELSTWHAGSGAFARVEMASTPSATVTLELEPGVLIEGVVRDEANHPLEAVEVNANWEGLEGPEDSKEASEALEAMIEPEEVSSELGIAYTDGEGRYRLGPLPPGWYSFHVTRRGYKEWSEKPREFTAGEKALDFTLERASIVEGHVVDSEGLPVEGETVHLSSLEAEGGDWGIDTTGSDGRFSFPVSQPGAYQVRVEGDRIHPLRQDITVPTGPLRLVGERLLHLEGEVLDEAGTPIPRVIVGLWPETAGLKDKRLVDAFTDDKGRFSLYVPAPGRYLVIAEAVGKGFLRTASQLVEVEGKEGARVRLIFEERRDLPVVLVDWRGRPVPKVLLQLVSVPRPVTRFGCVNPNMCVETDAEGRFTFRDFSGEQVDICVRTDGLSPLALVHGAARCVRAKGDGQEVRIVVGREVFVTGRLVHSDGSPVTRFRVNGREVRREDGELSVLIQRPGEEQLELSAPGLSTVFRTAPEFPEGSQIQDIGSIVLGP